MRLHGYGIVVRIQDGVVTKIEGDPTNPDNMGKLCRKGTWECCGSTTPSGSSAPDSK
jgi:hypothetical protein